MDISILIPAYNEAESLPHLIKWIFKTLKNYDYRYEIIIIDDGSTDKTWPVLNDLKKKYSFLKGIKFLNNYGKTAALSVGFKSVVGDVVITMDADLQDSPEEIDELYKMIQKEGFQLVSGWKKKRYDPLTKTIPTKLFNKVTRMMSHVNLHDFNCGLKAYKKDVVKNIQLYGEMHRYIPMIAKWKGYNNIGEKVVQHQARKYGKTKFGAERFIYGFLDLLSIFFVLKFKKRPMHFFGSIGLISFLSGGIISIWLILEKLIKIYFGHNLPRNITDQPLFFLALVLVILGSQLFLAGFLSELIVTTNLNQDDVIIEEKLGLE